MIEYIERGKAIKMRFSDGIDEDGVIYVPWRDVAEHLKTIPAADVVEVVRCKDCKYADEIEDNYCMCENTGAGMSINGFCSDGERRI